MKTTADCYRALLDGKKLIFNGLQGKEIKYLHLQDGRLFDNFGHLSGEAFTMGQIWFIYEEPCKHEPYCISCNIVRTDAGILPTTVFANCAKCGVKLKATWSPASET